MSLCDYLEGASATLVTSPVHWANSELNNSELTLCNRVIAKPAMSTTGWSSEEKHEYHGSPEFKIAGLRSMTTPLSHRTDKLVSGSEYERAKGTKDVSSSSPSPLSMSSKVVHGTPDFSTGYQELRSGPRRESGKESPDLEPVHGSRATDPYQVIRRNAQMSSSNDAGA